jgi:hyperosmotically inducible protein
MPTTRAGTLSAGVFHAALLIGTGALLGCQSVTPATLNEHIEDAAITAAVKTRIVTDPLMSVDEVSIQTVNNHVYLEGVVRSPEEKQRAHELAIEVGGVSMVVNRLEVRPQG